MTLDVTRSLTDEVGEQHGQQGRSGDGAHRRAFPAAVLGRLLELKGRAREGVAGEQARGRRVDGARGQRVAGRRAAEEGGRPRGRLEQEVPEEEEEEEEKHDRSGSAGRCVCVCEQRQGEQKKSEIILAFISRRLSRSSVRRLSDCVGRERRHQSGRSTSQPDRSPGDGSHVCLLLVQFPLSDESFLTCRLYELILFQ